MLDVSPSTSPPKWAGQAAQGPRSEVDVRSRYFGCAQCDRDEDDSITGFYAPYHALFVTGFIGFNSRDSEAVSISLSLLVI